MNAINPSKVRSIFDPSEDPGIDCSVEPSRTKQSFKDECTISQIVERAEKTGDFSRLMENGKALYGDFSSVPDYQESLNIVLRAQEQFEGLSAHVRDRFQNDPAQFLAFMEDPNNASEAVKLGLATARKPAGTEDRGVSQGGAGQTGSNPTGQGGSDRAAGDAAPAGAGSKV